MQDPKTEALFVSIHDSLRKLARSRVLQRAARLIEVEYADSTLSLKRAGRTSGASNNHLNRLIRQATGFTFHQLLVRYRLGKAIVLMKNPDHTLLEVTLESGFGSLSSFERNFKRCLGVRPREYRASQSGGEEIELGRRAG